MLKEFRDFAMKGNVLDLAIGVIMATTFGAVVKAAIEDVLMPIIAMIVGKPNFNDIHIGTIEIGKFITELVNFIIIAFVLFLIIKAANKAMGTKMAGGGHGDHEMMEHIKETMKEGKGH